jgi:hypothetical protein
MPVSRSTSPRTRSATGRASLLGAGAAQGLEELRVAALEDRLAADLDLGGHAAAVAELEELAGRYRFRGRAGGVRRAPFAA